MNFFVLGDSWGVGEWRRGNNQWQPVESTDTAHWLEQSGHRVTNISAGSASNFRQLRQTYWTLKNHDDYDWIIWFYTEPFRDIIGTVIDDPVDGPIQYPDFAIDDFPRCHYITKRNFEYAEMICRECHIPWIVIGGQTSVPLSIKQYQFAHHVIESWGRELLGLDFVFPEYTWFSWEKFRLIFKRFGIDEKTFIIQEMDALDRVAKIIKASKNHHLFPDNGHPSDRAHQELAGRLLDLIATST